MTPRAGCDQWGALLGFIGLIIALPLTTLLIAYYQRYVTKEQEDEAVLTEIESKLEEKLPENLAE